MATQFRKSLPIMLRVRNDPQGIKRIYIEQSIPGKQNKRVIQLQKVSNTLKEIDYAYVWTGKFWVISTNKSLTYVKNSILNALTFYDRDDVDVLKNDPNMYVSMIYTNNDVLDCKKVL